MQQRRFKQILGRSRPKRRTDAMGIPKEWLVEHTLGSDDQGGNFGAWHVFECFLLSRKWPKSSKRSKRKVLRLRKFKRDIAGRKQGRT